MHLPLAQNVNISFRVFPNKYYRFPSTSNQNEYENKIINQILAI